MSETSQEFYEKHRREIRLAEEVGSVSGSEWKHVLTEYKLVIKDLMFFPSWVYTVLALLSGAVLIFAPDGWRTQAVVAGVIGFAICLRHASRISGQIEGFQDGYERGREDGVLIAHDIPIQRKSELFQEVGRERSECIDIFQKPLPRIRE